ncbi:uncharacterized protein [Diadema antillarum]|uniref:uncharacterized protein n=1 Tax=Diadema antillarum TaxID=105358 RepID=UPI003A85B4EA
MDQKTVLELKKILSDRGIPCYGKRREELVTLAEKAIKLYNEIEDRDHKLSERKRRHVAAEDGSVVDLNGKTVQWTSDLKEMPSITLGDVFAYLTVECRWSSQRLKHHKSDDGYHMFVDKHVEMVEVGKIVDITDFVYIRGKVKPEQRHSADRYLTWLLCCSSGEVKSAGCGCVAA